MGGQADLEVVWRRQFHTQKKPTQATLLYKCIRSKSKSWYKIPTTHKYSVYCYWDFI